MFWHVTAVILIGLLIFSFNFFGITPKLFPKPKQNMKDIEFVLKGHSRHRVRHYVASSQQNQTNPNNTPKQEQSKITTETTPVAKNSNKNNTNIPPKTTAKHSQKSSVPDFSMPMPNLKSISSGLGASGKSKGHATGAQTSNSSIGDINNSFSNGNNSSGHSGFDKNATKKIITTYDISPYVNELKRNVRWNWKAPSQNKRVELFLRIAKDGKIIILNVKRTSEIGEVDNAALNAVRKCQPLNPLPSKYNKSYLDIIFTFDSNSVGSRY